MMMIKIRTLNKKTRRRFVVVGAAVELGFNYTRRNECEEEGRGGDPSKGAEWSVACLYRLPFVSRHDDATFFGVCLKLGPTRSIQQNQYETPQCRH